VITTFLDGGFPVKIISEDVMQNITIAAANVLYTEKERYGLVVIATEMKLREAKVKLPPA